MRIASLLIPAYYPPAFVGATPTPYNSGTIDVFERKLSALSPFILRHGNSARIRPDSQGRFVNLSTITQYDVGVMGGSLPDLVELALISFSLKELPVVFGTNVETLDLAAVAEMREGLHPWCEG